MELSKSQRFIGLTNARFIMFNQLEIKLFKNVLRRLVLRLSDAPALRERSYSDHRLLLPRTSRVEISQSEPWMSDLLELILQRFRGGLLDVGVNLGQTLCAYKLIDPSGNYLGSVDKLIGPEAGSGDMYEAKIAC